MLTHFILADSIIFITVDVFALVIQAAGGGIASSAATDSDAAVGANIMLAGIVIQLGAFLLLDTSPTSLNPSILSGYHYIRHTGWRILAPCVRQPSYTLSTFRSE